MHAPLLKGSVHYLGGASEGSLFLIKSMLLQYRFHIIALLPSPLIYLEKTRKNNNGTLQLQSDMYLFSKMVEEL